MAAAPWVKGHGLEEPFQHGVKTPSPDVFRLFVDLPGQLREAGDGLVRQRQRHPFRGKQSLVLA